MSGEAGPCTSFARHLSECVFSGFLTAATGGWGEVLVKSVKLVKPVSSADEEALLVPEAKEELA